MDDLKNHFRMGYAPEQLHHGRGGRRHHLERARAREEILEPIPRARSAAAHSHQGARATRRTSHHGVAPRAVALEMVAYHVPECEAVRTTPRSMCSKPCSPAARVRVSIAAGGQGPAGHLRARRTPDLDRSWPADVQLSNRAAASILRAPRKYLFEELDRLREPAHLTIRSYARPRTRLLATHYRELKTIAGRANLAREATSFSTATIASSSQWSNRSKPSPPPTCSESRATISPKTIAPSQR